MQFIKTRVVLPQSRVTIAKIGYRVRPLVYFLQKTWLSNFLTKSVGEVIPETRRRTKLYIYVLLLPGIYKIRTPQESKGDRALD